MSENIYKNCKTLRIIYFKNEHYHPLPIPKIIMDDLILKKKVKDLFMFEDIHITTLPEFPAESIDESDLKLNLNYFSEFVEKAHKVYQIIQKSKIEERGGRYDQLNCEIALVILPLPFKTMKYLPRSKGIVDWKNFDDVFYIPGQYAIVLPQKHFHIMGSRGSFSHNEFITSILRHLAFTLGMEYCQDDNCMLLKDTRSPYLCEECIEKLKRRTT